MIIGGGVRDYSAVKSIWYILRWFENEERIKIRKNWIHGWKERGQIGEIVNYQTSSPSTKNLRRDGITDNFANKRPIFCFFLMFFIIRWLFLLTLDLFLDALVIFSDSATHFWKLCEKLPRKYRKIVYSKIVKNFDRLDVFDYKF